ncbi:MAG: hypothetical protein IKP86_05650, partial [Anaerolineaceae bacterium]|nr:hypothetical protein [Anaerolineaceae bacterium]
EKAIFHGMAVDYHDRPQTMEELYREFQDRPVEPAAVIGNANTFGNDQTLRAADTDPQTKPGEKSKTGLAAALGVLLLAAAAFFLFFRSNITKFSLNILPPTETDVPTDTPTPFPTNTDVPTDTPTPLPTNTDVPTDTPTPLPTNTDVPTDTPTPFPTSTPEPTAVPLDLKAGEIFTFGRYEQDERSGADPIEWQVLAVENGRALLISRYALEAMKYNEEYEAVTWETCTLRSWLNGAFYGSVFNNEEKSRIAEVTNDNPDNAKYRTDGGFSTVDRIFLLSIDEANKYFRNDDARMCRATFHAKQNGANTYNGNAWWWLRSPGYGSDVAADVFPDGSVYDSGGYINNSGGSVRPAFWLNL